jgi:AcrR family transcriptional regulator
MRSEPSVPRSDLTAKALIREEALALFAERGPDRVSLRSVAAAAGVSPGLVIHHYGSRQGLRDAVDAHVLAVFEGMLARLEENGWSEDGATLAESIAAELPPGSPVPGYLRRLFTDGGEAGRTLFARLHVASRDLMQTLVAARMMRPVGDPEATAAFLLANDLALFVLRDQIGAVLGADPLSPDGLARWIEVAMTVYAGGVLTPGGPG